MASGFNEWTARFEAILHRADEIGAYDCELSIGPPASEAEVVAVETELGRSLPRSFRRVLTELSGDFALSWSLPDDLVLPAPFRELFAGALSWNLHRLPEIDRSVRQWIRVVFPDPEGAYDGVWHDKLGFHEVGNGDFLAIDVAPSVHDGPVVYLSHDDGQGHGYYLGASFIDAVDRMSRLGCVGAEDWQWLPFTQSSTSGIDPDGENGRLWRECFGLA